MGHERHFALRKYSAETPPEFFIVAADLVAAAYTTGPAFSPATTSIDQYWYPFGSRSGP
jgi:hypothetical protein